jgi:ADP-glucose pyrophosphorylase
MIMSNTMIGMHSLVEHSILDEDVSVGQFSYIGPGSSNNQGDHDVTVLAKGTVIPAHSTIDHGFSELAKAAPVACLASTVLRQ